MDEPDPDKGAFATTLFANPTDILDMILDIIPQGHPITHIFLYFTINRL